jgi:type I restriction enzyme, S subunit
MKSHYKRLGDYIHKIENRNTDLKVDKLLGLSMTKEFRESTSNIVGTDMSVYKVMSKWQFACDFMSVIRVYKLPVVLKTDDEPILVSPAYSVFEVKNTN